MTARNALCFVSSNFLPADRNWPSASNGSAAWAFCSAVRDFLVPNQVNWTRQAAIVVRSRSAGVEPSVILRPLVDRDSMRSIKALIVPPEKRKGEHWVRPGKTHSHVALYTNRESAIRFS